MKYTTNTEQQHQDDRELLRSWTIWHHSLHSVLTTADKTDRFSRGARPITAEPGGGRTNHRLENELAHAHSEQNWGYDLHTMDKLVDSN